MDHKTEKYLGTLLLRMAADARQEGDLVTAELLATHSKCPFRNFLNRLNLLDSKEVV